MLKRTLIVVALVALLATSAQALGPDPHTGKQGDHTGVKVNIEEMDIGWPFEYKALNLCVIPVYMHVGYFVQVEKCYDRKIKLVQVDCADQRVALGSNDGGNWPCYYDCEDVKIRANFEAKLGLKLDTVGATIDKWEAWFDGSDIVDASGGWNTVTVCVKAWKAKLYGTTPGTEVHVGNVTITVKPNV